MPQMKPMSWLYLYIYFFMFILIFNMMNFFFMDYKPIKKKILNKNLNNLNWKW